LIAREFVTAALVAMLIVAGCRPVRSMAQPSVTAATAAAPPTSEPAVSLGLGAPPRATPPPVSRSSSRLAPGRAPSAPATPITPPTTSVERPAGQRVGPNPTPAPNRAGLQASNVKTCQSADLNGSVGFQGATQALAGDLALTNHGASPCSLDGSPALHLVDAKGQALAIKEVTPPDAGPGSLVLVHPGQSAYVPLFWRDWCGSRPAVPLQVRASWPGSGGQVTAALFRGAPSDRHPLDLTPVCNAPSAGSTLSVYPFRSTP